MARAKSPRIGTDTWEKDGRPVYAALLIKDAAYSTDGIGEPYIVDPVLLDDVEHAIERFNGDPSRSHVEEAVGVVLLCRNLRGAADYEMRELMQRAFHHSYTRQEESTLLQLVFEALQQAIVRSFVAGLKHKLV